MLVDQLVEQIRGADLVDETHGAFAVEHSPMVLTPLGEAANSASGSSAP